MAPEDGKPKGGILTQSLIFAPRSHKRGAAGEYNHAGHDEEQHRRAEARDVRGRPVEDNPTGVSGFELTRLQQAQSGCGQEYGRGQHHHPLRDGKDRKSERFCDLHGKILR
jgi:hypothetical protein